MLSSPRAAPVLADHNGRFPVDKLRFDHKRLKVTVVATFEIDSNEARDEIEENIAHALSALGARGKLKADYEVIG